MQKLILLLSLIILSSCSSFKRKPVKDCNDNYAKKLEECMMRFSNQGYEAKAVVTICKSIYERRN